MRYAVVIEKADSDYSAYVPDLPGCVATGETVHAVKAEIREAIRFRVDGLKADGLPGPRTDGYRRLRRGLIPSAAERGRLFRLRRAREPERLLIEIRGGVDILHRQGDVPDACGHGVAPLYFSMRKSLACPCCRL